MYKFPLLSLAFCASSLVSVNAQIDTLCMGSSVLNRQFNPSYQLDYYGALSDSLFLLTGETAPDIATFWERSTFGNRSYAQLSPDSLQAAVDRLLELIGSASATPCDGLTQAFDFDGNAYDIVEIGDQCWFAENLQSEHYANGDALLANLDNSTWSSATSGAQAIYADDPANLPLYGRLYNGYAVLDSRGVCPAGWKVPSDDDWKALELFLGLDQASVDAMNWRGTDEGNQLKASSTDVPSWNGNNSTGFSAMPGGSRPVGAGGAFLYATGNGFWWSTTEWYGDLLYRRLQVLDGKIYRLSTKKGNGQSIRCLKN